MKRLLIVLAVLLVIIIGTYLLFFRTSVPIVTSVISTSTPVVGQAVQTYSNDQFGISFQYDSTQVGVLPQSTSSIAVYDLTTDPNQGQSIMRFNKLTSETLQQSIQRQVLSGYSTTTCTIDTTATSNGYVKAQISYPVPDNSPLGHEALCNASYDKTNGIRYFLYDPMHTDRFYFVSIGQYALLATPGVAWQDTIKIK